MNFYPSTVRRFRDYQNKPIRPEGRIVFSNSTVKTPIRNITRSAAKVFRIGGLFHIGGSIFGAKI